METQIIVLFCIIDDFLKAIGFADDMQVLMTTTEVITVAISAGMFFGGNHQKSLHFFKDYKYMKHVLSKSQFNRRLHRISAHIWERLQYILAQVFKMTNDSQQYVIDSFPIAVCHNIRISRCKIYKNKKYRGYCAAKREYFFGVRVHMIATVNGEPIEFYIAPGSVSDAKIFKTFDLNLPPTASLFGDALFNDYQHEDLIKETLGIHLLIARKANMNRQHTPSENFLIDHYRKTIETTFSRITQLFPKKIHSVTSRGFELKVFLFIFAYSISFL